MSSTFKISEFSELTLLFKHILIKHGVADEVHLALIPELVDEVAQLARRHVVRGDDGDPLVWAEEVTMPSLVSSNDAKVNSYSGDYPLVDIKLIFGNKLEFEFNLFHSHMEHPEHLILDVEMAMGIREYEDLNQAIDCDARYQFLLEKESGIKEVLIKPLKEGNSEEWISLCASGCLEEQELQQKFAALIQLIKRIGRDHS